MQYDQLRAKVNDCEIWFEGFFDGYPRYRGKFKEIFDNKKYGKCEHVKNFILEYLPLGDYNFKTQWKIISPVDHRFTETLATVREQSDPRYQITLPSEHMIWDTGYSDHAYKVDIIAVVRKLSRIVQKIRPFSWRSFFLAQMDQREQIRFIYLCFYRLFDMSGVKLPEEILNHILSFNNIIL